MIVCRSESTPNQQAVKLYDIIQDRGSRAFDGFVKVLLASDRLRHFGEMLRGSDTSNPYGKEIVLIQVKSC